MCRHRSHSRDSKYYLINLIAKINLRRYKYLIWIVYLLVVWVTDNLLSKVEENHLLLIHRTMITINRINKYLNSSKRNNLIKNCLLNTVLLVEISFVIQMRNFVDHVEILGRTIYNKGIKVERIC
jgi:hypothetical protein